MKEYWYHLDVNDLFRLGVFRIDGVVGVFFCAFHFFLLP
ncbi:hypothetical protein ADIS_1563 [Lunatimonas lonarensis]|uniref:Uncharacterized protein n=1 Tax=Lunatimonas lonarensis TaxID=1232681 RepID=R7ZVI3_9BACT|nr:hypothetical protein ADIS_1563 [Lunatimonas lonarensis]